MSKPIKVHSCVVDGVFSKVKADFQKERPNIDYNNLFDKEEVALMKSIIKHTLEAALTYGKR